MKENVILCSIYCTNQEHNINIVHVLFGTVNCVHWSKQCTEWTALK